MQFGITLSTVFSDTTMPIGTDQDAALRAIAGLANWFQVDDATVTVSGGDITTWTDKMGSGKTLTQGIAGQRATLSAAAIGGYPAAAFSAASSDYYRLTGGVLPWTNPHTLVAVCKLPSVITINNMIFGAASSNGWYLGRIGTGLFRFRCGGNAEVAGVSEDHWNLFVASYDGSSTVKLGVNGGSPVSGTGSDPTVTGDTVVSGIAEGGGSYFNGLISDLMIFNDDLYASGREADLATVASYFKSAYGIGG